MPQPCADALNEPAGERSRLKNTVAKVCKLNNFLSGGQLEPAILSCAMALTVAIVGAGRVGCGLGRRMRELGWRIGAVVTRSRATARRAVCAIGGGVAHGGLTRQAVGADLILIATPDDAIEPVARDLAGIGGSEWRGKIVLHTSGALDRTALGPLAELGASTGSIHPLQTFSGRGSPRAGWRRFRN